MEFNTRVENLTISASLLPKWLEIDRVFLCSIVFVTFHYNMEIDWSIDSIFQQIESLDNRNLY